jgi:hypothetical protein
MVILARAIKAELHRGASGNGSRVIRPTLKRRHDGGHSGAAKGHLRVRIPLIDFVAPVVPMDPITLGERH